jgi:hypothetical protein
VILLGLAEGASKIPCQHYSEGTTEKYEHLSTHICTVLLVCNECCDYEGWKDKHEERNCSVLL